MKFVTPKSSHAGVIIECGYSLNSRISLSLELIEEKQKSKSNSDILYYTWNYNIHFISYCVDILDEENCEECGYF